MKRPFRILGLSFCVGLLPVRLAAQQAAPPQQVRIEQVESGVVIAPDAKFTEVNDRFATLAGAYGGWMTDRTLLVGAGAYWLANRGDDFKMAYGGGVVQWIVRGDRRIGFGARGLVGFGAATLSSTYGELFEVPLEVDPRSSRVSRFGMHGGSRSPVTSDTRVLVEDDFFIAEPQLNAIWNFTDWMRLDTGVGYRLIAGSDLLNDQLRGVSGSIALQFGGR